MVEIAELFNGSTFAENTWIFPGHEYSHANLQFASICEPSNTELQVIRSTF
jgi:hypothetical protein